MNNMFKVKECERCKGKGYAVVRGAIYRFARVKCVHCNGEGVIKTVIPVNCVSVRQNI